MATRNIVPRATGEGSIGTSEKTWGSINVGSINAEGINVYSERTAPVNTLQRETAYVVDDIVYSSKLNAKYYLLCITAGTTASVEPSFSGAESNTQITDGTVVWRVQTITSQEKAAGVPIGFEYFSMNPNIPQGSLPLLGGEYSRETYSALWSWVQEQTGYLKTEAEWQALSTSNNGNVPFYSDGDGSTTFRVPSLHCWIKGSDGSAQLVGSYLQAGLPNIEGSLKGIDFRSGVHFGISLYNAIGSGALSPTASGDPSIDVTIGETLPANYNDTITLNASASNSIYGNSTTVQPESIVGMWLVKAYGTIVDTGSIDEQAYINDRFNASKQYTDTQIQAKTAFPSTTNVPISYDWQNVHTYSYTCPADGWLQASFDNIAAGAYVYLENTTSTVRLENFPYWVGYPANHYVLMPCSKNDVVSISLANPPTTYIANFSAKFIYAKNSV